MSPPPQASTGEIVREAIPGLDLRAPAGAARRKARRSTGSTAVAMRTAVLGRDHFSRPESVTPLALGKDLAIRVPIAPIYSDLIPI